MRRGSCLKGRNLAHGVPGVVGGVGLRHGDNISLPDSVIVTSRPVKLSDFAEHYRIMSADSDFRFSEEYEELINHFIASPAFEEDSFSLTHYLLETNYRIPAITIAVCERFLERFSGEARDISTSRAVDSRTVSSLVYRTYAQHDEVELQSSCLDLIDSMCIEGVYDALRGIADFER